MREGQSCLASIKDLLNSDRTYPPWRLNSSMEHKASERWSETQKRMDEPSDGSESQCSYSWFTSSLSCPLVTKRELCCLPLLGSKGNSQPRCALTHRNGPEKLLSNKQSPGSSGVQSPTVSGFQREDSVRFTAASAFHSC